MLKVPQQQYIRFLREVEGCSIQEIAERVQVNWRTAKKYADRDDWNEPVCKRKGRHPVLGPYLEIIDTWLEDDERLPRKQRHTAVRMFQRLRDEYGFPGGQRTVSEYVSKRKKAMAAERAEHFERLEHPGGEAQADFGTVYVVKSGELVERKVLTLSFPYSNAAFVFPVPKENTECFLEALGRLFQQMGGVPRKIWFDNLSAAVVSIQQGGKRECTEAFRRFCAHYRFEPLFCNPYSGHEKGHVENKVGYGRRNWCVPPPVIDTPEQLETYLAEAARADMQRPHYVKKQTIAELWEQEKCKLLTLPTTPLEIFRLETCHLNKYAELSFDAALFPLPQCRAMQPVLVKVKWDVLEVLTADGTYTPIVTLPRPYTEKVISVDWKAVLKRYEKRPRAVMYSSFTNMMPQALQTFLTVEDMNARKARIRLLHRLLDTYTLEEIGQVLGELSHQQEHLAVALEHALYAIKHPVFRPEPFSESHTPPALHGQIPMLDEYDRILGVRVE
ncbi:MULTISPECIES: IS21 family transposase [Brevibacillus]|uniref:IS21 family transposase n=1 Tax=Brevibacillus brevis TaxID=1393 RepID=A0ABY9SWV6_BREBE|nr:MULTISPECIES: IS21 family transposase [Brevibacillus]WNC12295.1 IS21 family transposase [Brevibacillus brevis]WNC13040.1 IS21 family transposase [Brevibacillus brevis]WNC13059.1 IS21 family transposase [Brevibacillus brevis]WNC14277.1 IS21 family transposase [Brevibacillus brevis]WNC14357.1 IS21 family transposase [Brevibacillus brevis]